MRRLHLAGIGTSYLGEIVCTGQALDLLLRELRRGLPCGLLRLGVQEVRYSAGVGHADFVGETLAAVQNVRQYITPLLATFNDLPCCLECRYLLGKGEVMVRGIEQALVRDLDHLWASVR